MELFHYRHKQVLTHGAVCNTQIIGYTFKVLFEFLSHELFRFQSGFKFMLIRFYLFVLDYQCILLLLFHYFCLVVKLVKRSLLVLPIKDSVGSLTDLGFELRVDRSVSRGDRDIFLKFQFVLRDVLHRRPPKVIDVGGFSGQWQGPSRFVNVWSFLELTLDIVFLGQEDPQLLLVYKVFLVVYKSIHWPGLRPYRLGI